MFRRIPSSPRFARLNTPWVGFLASVALLAVLIVALARDSAWFARDTEEGEGTPRLMLFCAAGIRAPVAEVAAEYEKAFGVEVHIQYGGSETLLAKLAELKNTNRVDLYLPADDSYLDM